MRRRQHQIALLIILVVTGFSLFVTWPGNPDRYLPDFIPWPSGHGLNIGGFDRDEFRLGLDLAGGVSVTLQASGRVAQVRPGETLTDLARRRDVISIIAEDVANRNEPLSELDVADFDRTLPRDLQALLVPAALVGGEGDDVSVVVGADETLLEFVGRQDVAGLLRTLNPQLDAVAEEDGNLPLPLTVTQITLPLNLPADQIAASIQEARDIIEERVNGFGISEAEVTVLGDNRINAQIPGVSAAQAADLVGSTAVLEFREIDPDQPRVPPPVDPFVVRVTLEDAFDPLFLAGALPPGSRLATYVVSDPAVDVIVLGGNRWIPAVAIGAGGFDEALTGRFLIPDSIQRDLDNNGQPALAFGLSDDGAVLFERITERLAASQAPLGIFVDRQLISAPTVNTVISDSGIITGLSDEDVDDLRRQLRAGALPINFEVIQQTEVAATLGQGSVADTVQAGLVAFLAIALFMIVYYRLPGLLAALALLVYAAAVMATFKLLPVTLTLAGIAGFVLSVGLAVDANILIFERMKEELRLGRSLQGAIETGWNRAWPAIRDANVSTLITVAILWFFADALNANLIKSFAIALFIGTVFSMASAIFVTRTFLHVVADFGLARRPWLFGLREMAGDEADAPTAPAGTERRGDSAGGG